MNVALVMIGLGKVVFGLLVGALGVFFASRVLGRLLRSGPIDVAVREGNLAMGVLNAFGVISLGILVQHAVIATFDAVDLLYRDHVLTPQMVARFGGYALVHVGFALCVGAGVLALGAWVFGKLTRDVDEIEEVKRGNLAAAFVLGGVLVVMALMTAPGLQTALDGLLPLPILGEGEHLAPS